MDLKNLILSASMICVTAISFSTTANAQYPKTYHTKNFDHGSSWLGTYGKFEMYANRDAGNSYAYARLRSDATVSLAKLKLKLFKLKSYSYMGGNVVLDLNVGGFDIDLDADAEYNGFKSKALDWSDSLTLWQHSEWIILGGFVPLNLKADATLDLSADIGAHNYYASTTGSVSAGVSASASASIHGLYYPEPSLVSLGIVPVSWKAGVSANVDLLEGSLSSGVFATPTKFYGSATTSLKVGNLKVKALWQDKYLKPSWCGWWPCVKTVWKTIKSYELLNVTAYQNSWTKNFWQY